jgi:hypothetical protein
MSLLATPTAANAAIGQQTAGMPWPLVSVKMVAA